MLNLRFLSNLGNGIENKLGCNNTNFAEKKNWGEKDILKNLYKEKIFKVINENDSLVS